MTYQQWRIRLTGSDWLVPNCPSARAVADIFRPSFSFYPDLNIVGRPAKRGTLVHPWENAPHPCPQVSAFGWPRPLPPPLLRTCFMYGPWPDTNINKLLLIRSEFAKFGGGLARRRSVGLSHPRSPRDSAESAGFRGPQGLRTLRGLPGSADLRGLRRLSERLRGVRGIWRTEKNKSWNLKKKTNLQKNYHLRGVRGVRAESAKSAGRTKSPQGGRKSPEADAKFRRADAK